MISAIVLAAGAGERMGASKALVELGGVTLLERVIGTCARSTVDEIVVVTGAAAPEVEALVERVRGSLPAAVLRSVRSEAWRDGRTGSIQAGWGSCPAGAHALIFPVDHPCVRLVTLDTMLGVFGYAASDLDVLVPAIELDGVRRRGHPILVSARLREAVATMGRDEPLRALLRRHALLEVPVDDEGILRNLDTPEDVAAAAALL